MWVIVDDMSKDWAGELAERIADEVRRLRGKRSGQWLSDRTAALGNRVSRTTISELENGKRRYVTVAELVVLARALNTTPVALVYPGPYDDIIDVSPGSPALQLWAAQWFSGLTETDPWPGSPEDDEADYERNLRGLRTTRKVAELGNRKTRLRTLLGPATDDAERAAIFDQIDDIQRQIDDLTDKAAGDGR